MLAGTHAAFFTALNLGGAAVLEYPVEPVSWGLAVLFSFMPDIETPTSKVGRPLFFISVTLKKRFGHLSGVNYLGRLTSYPGEYCLYLSGVWGLGKAA